MNPKIIAYAMDFSSFLMQHFSRRELIRTVIVFGSVARGDEDAESDIDLFIDVVQTAPVIEKEIKKIHSNFLESMKVQHYWKLLGVENEISLKIGILAEWDELLPSIIANGIVIFGKFKAQAKEVGHKAYFFWENVKPNSKRVLLNRQLFGFKQGNRDYQGFLQKFSGERFGKGCIGVPLEHALVFQQLFKKHKVTVKLKKILEY
ncbi:nucleotidyltransferase domain-containing protein [Candidatus Woesearchaeota archaeon]|nr:nucleotidyltransferase domain-containing protein [Candidatus Woesearchaeota archaeon]